jgi:hypothetical protein
MSDGCLCESGGSDGRCDYCAGLITKITTKNTTILALLRRVWEDEYAFRTEKRYGLCLKCNGDDGKHTEGCIITCLQKALGDDV